ncbi:MAG: class I SAM-dependent methyltransferase [Phycisphaerales bacterium]|nr:class I SAM-dependent methyltransferase [Phycisphaerales bacterium]
MAESTLPDFGWSETTATSASASMAPSIDGLISSFQSNGPVSIIELGCGNGRLLSKLQRDNRQWTGIDASVTGIELAKKIAPKAQLHQMELSDALLDHLGSEPFDIAVSLEVVEHMYDPWVWARSALAAIRPGGLLIASTPYHGWLKNCLISVLGRWDKHHNSLRTGGHIKFLSRSTFLRLLTEVGFEEVTFQGIGRCPGLWKNMLVTAKKPT